MEEPRFRAPHIERQDYRRHRMDLPPPGIPDRSSLSWRRPANEDEERTSSKRNYATFSRPPPLVAIQTNSDLSI